MHGRDTNEKVPTVLFARIILVVTAGAMGPCVGGDRHLRVVANGITKITHQLQIATRESVSKSEAIHQRQRMF